MNLVSGDQQPSVLLSQLEKDQTRGGRDQKETSFQEPESEQMLGMSSCQHKDMQPQYSVQTPC